MCFGGGIERYLINENRHDYINRAYLYNLNLYLFSLINLSISAQKCTRTLCSQQMPSALESALSSLKKPSDQGLPCLLLILTGTFFENSRLDNQFIREQKGKSVQI